MNAKHSPGPWRCGPMGVGYQTGYVYSPQSVRIALVGNIDSELGVSRDVLLANAALIAAAPELLAALKELVGQRDAHFHTQSAWDAARAAIAKAEGAT